MRIQCPNCRQKFDVSEDLYGERVACGSCDDNFYVDSDTILADKEKVYPSGKNRDSRDQLRPKSKRKAMPEAFQQAQYSQYVSMAQLDTTVPKRLLATSLGVVIVVVTMATFLLAGGEKGAMRHVLTNGRYILTGFAALLAGGLFIFGMNKNRTLGVFLALFFGAGLLSMPYFYPATPSSKSSAEFDNVEVFIEGDDSIAPDAMSHEDKLLAEIGYAPMAEALAENDRAGVMGVFMRDSSYAARSVIANSIYKHIGEIDRGITYARDDNSLLVLTKQRVSIDDLAVICEKYGEVLSVSKKLRIIELQISGETSYGNSANIFNSSKPDFQKLNLQALNSISSLVRLGAIKRLGDSKPIALRHDIVTALVNLLPKGDHEHQLAIIKTLKTWSKPDDGIGTEAAVLAAVKSFRNKGESVNAEAIEFLIERDIEGSKVILMELWDEEPVVWSELLITLDGDAEAMVLKDIKSMNTKQFLLACHVLKQVGTEGSLGILKSMLNTKEEQSEKTLKATIDEIEKRL